MSATALKTFDPDKVHPATLHPDSGCNTSDEVLLAQVAANIRRGLPQVQPHAINPDVAILVCGGPSLAITEDELVEAHWRGGKVVAVNGAYQWCIDRNIKPSAAVMLDARAFNSRFLATPVPGCRYLIASQCHADTFDLCRDRDVLIWHACSAGDAEVDLLKDYYFEPKDTPDGFKNMFPVTVGTTVGVRSLSLLRMLGFTHMEIFGLDSCWLEDSHHAYAQPENNRDLRLPIWLRPEGRDDKAQRFMCAPWHLKQADDFMKLIRERGDLFQLNVHGPGLIATILKTGAEIQMETKP
jgi:hypothetical protein